MKLPAIGVAANFYGVFLPIIIELDRGDFNPGRPLLTERKLLEFPRIWEAKPPVVCYIPIPIGALFNVLIEASARMKDWSPAMLVEAASRDVKLARRFKF